MGISFSSFTFILILLVSPIFLVKGNRKAKLALISLACLYLASNSIFSFLMTLVYILIPYIYCCLFKKRKLMIVLWIALFIYLRKYEIMGLMGIPYAPFEIAGISYIFFRAISYIRTSPKGKGDILAYISYILSIYTFFSGPVVSYELHLNDIKNKNIDIPKKEYLIQLNRTANGLLKITVLSNILLKFSDLCFEKETVLGMMLFSILNYAYVYINFSGYTDVVIGISKLAGFNLLENFNRPYMAITIDDFWRRWHMSLSSWFKDNVYIPLGGNRKGKARSFLNLFICTFLLGLWHGTNLNFVIFGMLNALGIILAKVIKEKVDLENKVLRCIFWLITQSYICLSMCFLTKDILSLIL